MENKNTEVNNTEVTNKESKLQSMTLSDFTSFIALVIACVNAVSCNWLPAIFFLLMSIGITLPSKRD